MTSLGPFATKRNQLSLESFQPIASNWSHSEGVVRVNVDFEWTIHDYELRGAGKSLESDFFRYFKAQEEPLFWKLILDDEGIKT